VILCVRIPQETHFTFRKPFFRNFEEKFLGEGFIKVFEERGFFGGYHCDYCLDISSL